jgi:hypothetical protein
MVRQHPPEVRCWILTGRMSRSASLFDPAVDYA